MISLKERTELAARYSFKEISVGKYHSGTFKNKNEIDREFFGQREVYKSFYNYKENITEHISKNKTVKGYKDDVCADEFIIDIDCEDRLEDAQNITKELVDRLRNDLDVKFFKVYFSGNKGFHLEIPSWLFGEFWPSPSIYKRMKYIANKIIGPVIISKYEGLEKEIGKKIFDYSIYTPNSVIRVPNTQNAKSGLYKIPLTFNEVETLSVEEIKGLARGPRELKFEEPAEKAENTNLFSDNYDAYIKIPASSSSDYEEATKTGAYEGREIESDKLKMMMQHCNWSSEFLKDTIFNNDERIKLAQLLLPFEEGKEWIHKILRKTDNYDEGKTDYHLSIMERDGYKPPLCKEICGDNICPAMKAYGKNSPIAFAYVNEMEAFVEKVIIEKFLNNHPGLLYSLGDEEFYEYDKGKYVKIKNPEMLTKIERFIKIILKPSLVTSTNVKKIRDHLSMIDSILFTDEFNKDKGNINLLNGIYSLEDKKLEEHSPSLPNTIQLSFEYNSNAKAPKFMKFLTEIFEGDEDKIDYVLRMMCYFLIPDYSYQKIFILLGKGRNGKSVLSSIITELCGSENVNGVSISGLVKNNFAGIQLKDKLLNISSELNTKDIEIDMLKRLSGQDLITFDRKYKEPVSFVNHARLLILANRLPRFSEFDTAITERLVILKFNRSFRKEEANTNLLNELKEELPGIFNLVVSKYDEIMAGGGGIYISVPEVIQNETKLLSSEISTVAEFLMDECEFDDAGDIKLKELYSSYKSFCKERNYLPYGYRNFQSSLEAFSEITIKKGNSGNVVYGIKCHSPFINVVGKNFTSWQIR